MDRKAAANLLRMSASKIRQLNYPNYPNNIPVPISIKNVDTNFVVEGAESFWKLIDSLLNQQITINKEHILEASKVSELKLDYLRQIYPDVEDIIQETVPDIETYTKKFYSAGKEAGITNLGVKAFTGASDTNALFHLTNYNYELIRQLTDDLASGVRQEVWQGVARDRGLKEIAKRIEKVQDLVPLRRGKRVWSIADRAKLIAHTESSRARHQGLYMTFKQYDVAYYDLVNTPWKRLCADCKALAENNPYPIDDLTAWAPIHVKCHCGNIAAADPAEKASDPDEFMNMVTGEMEPVSKDLVFAI